MGARIAKTVQKLGVSAPKTIKEPLFIKAEETL